VNDDERKREWIEERAAIREFDGGMPREKAEKAAELDWRDTIDRDAERAKREIHDMATTARRSLWQRIRYDRAEVRRMCA
jgi:hypothetical protein